MKHVYTLFTQVGDWVLLGLLSLVSLTGYGQCSIAVNHVTVSGCYSVSGTSRATVSAEIAWSKPPANGYIIVTTGTHSRTITPGEITVTYPQVTGAFTGKMTIVSPKELSSMPARCFRVRLKQFLLVEPS